MPSTIETLADLSLDERRELIRGLPEGVVRAWLYDWKLWARPKQLPPEGVWFAWLILAGRGFGKTMTGAEWVRKRVEEGARRIALVAETAADARDVLVEGESGLMAVFPPNKMPRYEPSKRRVIFHTGVVGTTFSGEEPKQLRGPQFDTAWVDELAKYRLPEDTWDNLTMGLRLGNDPRACITTTPRPIPIINSLVRDTGVAVTRGSSYENISNLAITYIERVIARYEGTRLGRQELHAEILTDTPGALWSYDLLERQRLRANANLPKMARVVVGVDPAMTSHEESDETGIVVAGLGVDGNGYVLADYSCRLSPGGWARQVVDAYHDHSADRVVAEANAGGEMVEQVIRTVERNISYKHAWAGRSKAKRAEPVAALYEQGKVFHVGTFASMEDQMCATTPEGYLGGNSPDRMDAMVWAVTELMLGARARMPAPPSISFTTM